MAKKSVSASRTKKKPPVVLTTAADMQQPILSSGDLMRWTFRLDESIGKLAQATTDLSVGVAAHTERLDHMEEESREQRREVKELSDKHTSDFRYLDTRISTVQRELSEKILAQTTTVTTHMDTAATRITQQVKDAVSTTDKKIDDVGGRVGSLEKWRWVIYGGAIIVGFIVTGVLTVLLMKIFEMKVPSWFQ